MAKEIKFKVTLENGDVIEKVAENLNDLATAQKQTQDALSSTKIDSKEYKALSKDLKDVEKAQIAAKTSTMGLGERLAAIPGPIGAVTQGFQGISKAATAFVANPIGAVVAALGLVFTAVYKAIQSTEKGMMAMNKIMGAFGGIIDPIVKIVGELAAVLAEGVVGAIEGVVGLIGKLIPGFEESAKAGMDLAQSLNEIDVAEGDLAVSRAEANKQLAEARETLSDTNKSLKERKVALADIRKAEESLAAQEVALAQKTLAAARERIKLQGESKANLEAEEAALIKLAGAEQDLAAKRRLFNKEEKKLTAEAEADKKAAAAEAEARAKESAAKAKARSDAAVSLQKEALKSAKQAEDEAYLLSIKDEAVRAQEALKIQQRNQDAEIQLKIDGLEKIKSRTKAENAALAALRAQQAAVDIAQVAQTEALITKQKEDAEKKRIDDEKKAADESKAVAEKAYADRQSTIDNDYKQQEIKLIESGATLDEIKKQQDDADLARLEAKIAAAKAAGEMGAQDVINLELDLATKKAEIADADLKKTEEDEKKKAEVRMQTFNGIIQAASAVTNAIAAIQEAQMQKELKGAGDNLAKQEEIKKKYFEKQKKVQIANAIIGTIQGAVQAFTSLASIPVVGPVLGGIAAAAALVAGYANVQKIKDTQYEGAGAGAGGSGGGGAGAAPPPPPPSMFAEGGLVTGPGTAVSDSIPARLSNGESVINANSTAMFGGLLSAINEIGGGKKFAEGGIGGSMEAPIVKTYVVASDVTSQQEADFQIQQIARL